MNELVLLSLGIYGIAIVISLLVAALIKGIVVALPMLERRHPEPALRAATPAAAVPPEHIAAIAAALTVGMGERHIVHIEDRRAGTVWSAEGRMIHQTSHAPSRRQPR